MAYMNLPESGSAEHVEHLARVIAGIDDPCRSVVVPREIQDGEITEIAEALGMSPRTMKRYIRRGRRVLSKHLQEAPNSETMNSMSIPAATHQPVDAAETNTDLGDLGHRHKEDHDLRLSTGLSIAIFESDLACGIGTPALLGLGISAIVLSVVHGLSLLNPSGPMLNMLVLFVAPMSVVSIVLASDAVFRSDRDTPLFALVLVVGVAFTTYSLSG